MMTTLKPSRWWLSIEPLRRTLGSVASLFASTFALDYRLNWEINTPDAVIGGMLLHINIKFIMRKLKLSLFHKVSFLSGHQCQLIGVGKGMQQT
jgi:hypothetical protein